MKIGISRPFVDPGHPIPDVDMGAVGQIAEEVGFDWMSYGHHTIRPLDEPVLPPHFGVPLYQDPLIGATRALALTKRLEVATGVLIMPMQHPVVLAKQVGTIDRYSGGRFFLGLGTGGASRLEIELSGGSFEKRWEYTMESIQVMKGLWTQDRFTFEGKYFKLPPVLLGPRPITQPHTQIWLGGMTDSILQRIGRECDGWLPVYNNDHLAFTGNKGGMEYIKESRNIMRRAAEQAGRTPGHFEIAVLFTPNTEQSRDTVRRFEDAGADRIAFSLPKIKDEAEARAALESLAAKVLK